MPVCTCMPLLLSIVQIPDGDLLKRVTNLKVDPLSGEVYSKSTYEPAKPVRKDSGQDEEADDEEEEEKEEDNLNEVSSEADSHLNLEWNFICMSAINVCCRVYRAANF